MSSCLFNVNAHDRSIERTNELRAQRQRINIEQSFVFNFTFDLWF